MRSLIFIETPEDFKRVRDHLNSSSFQGEETLIVNLNSSFRFDVSELSEVRYRTESDYLSLMPLNALNLLNQKALQDVRTWLAEPEMASCLRSEGIDLGLVAEYSLVRAVTTAYKFIELVQKVLEIEKPDRVFAVRENAQTKVSDIRFDIHDKLAAKVLAVLFSGKKTGNTAIEWLEPLKTAGHHPLPASQGAKRLVKRAANAARQLWSGTLGAIHPKKETLLVLGAPRIMFPVIRELLQILSYRISYLQRTTSPRLLGELVRRGVGYETLENIPAGDIERVQEKETRFRQLLKDSKLFTYEGMALTSILDEKFTFLFKHFFPSVTQDIRRLKTLLERTRCRFVITDEDTSYFARTLLLTARSLGIPCAEFQHGVVTKYLLHSQIADKKFVWGKYFKETVERDAKLAPGGVSVVGPVHYEYLHGMKQEKCRRSDRTKVQNRFRIPEGQKIVLFAPHPFHKSSKGGILDLHQTRQEAETVLAEVAGSLNGRTDVRLLIKLHQADSNVDFYREFLKREAESIPYSLIRHEPSLRTTQLINASDCLICPNSTAILEAILLDAPVILLDYQNRRKVALYTDWKAVECVKEKGRLKSVLDLALSGRQAFLERVREGRSRIKNDFAAGADGRSGARLREEVEGLLR